MAKKYPAQKGGFAAAAMSHVKCDNCGASAKRGAKCPKCGKAC